MSDRSEGADDALVGLLGLPAMGPARLRRILDHHGDPRDAWAAVRRGGLDAGLLGGRLDRRDELVARWRTHAADHPAEGSVARHRAAGVRVLGPGDRRWPSALVDDPEPPALLFVVGDTAAWEVPPRIVAIVGTRRATAGGLRIARSLGRGLAEAGVAVVSGLALGIDGAAHDGVLAAGGHPVGIVATGLDRCYPPRHAGLWQAVGAAGALVSEAPLGVGPERWRFPARNRLMAALADLVVVVESGVRGGSMRTVEAAIDRQTDVCAVPGAVGHPASAGTNQLLFEGCGVVRDVDDVLGALGFAVSPSGAVSSGGAVSPRGAVLPDAPGSGRSEGDLDPVLRNLHDLLGSESVAIDDLVAASGTSATAVLAGVSRLEARGLAVRTERGIRRGIGS